jgi:hypothetical protein
MKMIMFSLTKKTFPGSISDTSGKDESETVALPYHLGFLILKKIYIYSMKAPMASLSLS